MRARKSQPIPRSRVLCANFGKPPIFRFDASNGSFRLAVADPSDTAAIRAAEIVFGMPVDVVVASYEDITTVLDQRADADDANADQSTGRVAQSDDDIESLRDLAS